MTVCCMFIILLGCKFLHTAHAQTTCACKEQVKPLCPPVSVPCPDKPKNYKLKIVLFNNTEEIFSVSCDQESGTDNCPPAPHTKGGMTYVDKDNVFIINEVTGSSNGIYQCKVIQLYPPPLKTLISDVKIQALGEGHICEGIQSSTNQTEIHPSHGFLWIWTAAVVLLIIYSITVTIIALANWVKLRKTESNSDYMNTKPRAPRERRKKKGVQNPVPRYF